MDPDRPPTVTWLVRLEQSRWRRESYYRFRLVLPNPSQPVAWLSLSLIDHGTESKESSFDKQTIIFAEYPAKMRNESLLTIRTELRLFTFTVIIKYVDHCDQPPCKGGYISAREHRLSFEDSTRQLRWGLVGFVGPGDGSTVLVQHFMLQPVLADSNISQGGPN